MTIPIIVHLADSVATSDAWLCDIWGVLHNGRAAFPAAVEALRQYRLSGGICVLVSNAPRPAAAVETQLARLGIPRDTYAEIITSGDVTRTLLGDVIPPLLHIGPERDRGLFEGRSVQFVAAADAGLIVCSGLYDDTRETPEDYRAVLISLAARRVPMLCANPDLKVDRGGEIIWCAGAIAALYGELGGPVTTAGKPFRAVYDAAFAAVDRLAGRAVEKSRILAIGDGVGTDIAGARSVGIPSLYVASAIHLDGALTPESLANLFAGVAPLPIAAMAGLAW